MCKCIYHENIGLLYEALHTRSQKLPIGYKDLSTADNIWVKTVCSKYDKNCVYRCSSCGTSVIPSLFPFHNCEEEVEVSQRTSVNVERKPKKHSEIKDNNQYKDSRITKYI